MTDRQRPPIPEKLEIKQKLSLTLRAFRSIAESAKKTALPIAAALGVAYGAAETARHASRPWTGFDPALQQELRDKIAGAFRAKREGGIPAQLREWWKRFANTPPEQQTDPVMETRWALQLRLEIMNLRGTIDDGVFWGALVGVYVLTSGIIRRRVQSILGGLAKRKEQETDRLEKNEIRETLNQIIDVLNFLDQRVLAIPTTNASKEDIEQLVGAVDMLSSWADELSKELNLPGPQNLPGN